MLKFKAIICFMTLVVICQGLNEEENSKYWLVSCNHNDCSSAFSSCMNCFGERACKSCISYSKPGCSACADDIYNKNDLETINGNQYLICDSLDPIQSTVCHLYCRGQFAQSGQCTVENGLPICKCSSQSGSLTTQSSFSTTTKESTISPNKPLVYFNGSVKLNVSISTGYRRILPLPNGDLVRASRSNLIEIWDMQQGVIKKNLSSVYSSLDLNYYFSSALGLLSNGDLVAGYGDSTFLIFDLKITEGESLKKVIENDEDFICLTILKNDDLAIGQGGNLEYGYDIVIRNSQDGNIKKRLVGHQDNVYQIIELDNGNLVSCSDDGTVKVWNVTSGVVLKSITFSTYVKSIAILKNGYLAAGLATGTISIWNLETNQLIRNLVGHSYGICQNNCLQILDNGDLLSGSYDQSLKVWNPNDGTLKLTSKLHKGSVFQLAISPKGNIISSSGYDLIVWN